MAASRSWQGGQVHKMEPNRPPLNAIRPTHAIMNRLGVKLGFALLGLQMKMGLVEPEERR